MLVEELVARLLKLDQKRTIKFECANGYDLEIEADDTVGIEVIKDTEYGYIRKDGSIDKYNHFIECGDIKELVEECYVLGPRVEKGEIVDQRKNPF